MGITSCLINNMETVAWIFLGLSGICVLVSGAVLCGDAVRKGRILFNSKLIIITVSLTLSLWSLQFLSDLYKAGMNTEYIVHFPELVVSSFFHALKTFGADADFVLGIANVEKLIAEKLMLSDIWVTVYGVYASMLAFVAPIISGTVLFEILSNVFPKVKLWLMRMVFFRGKYYFSDLNERSLALAKSIISSHWGVLTRPVIVFADVYADKNKERPTEMISEAKHIGAICLRDDIAHIRKTCFGESKVFLIDDNEVENLRVLINLTDDFNHKIMKKAEIYLFCQDYIYADVEKQARKKLTEKYGYKSDSIKIFPVRSYRNLITSMLEKTPLYEPVVHEKPDEQGVRDINITIIGAGDIGREMFLTTYWMGQMINCRLNINVVSKESEEEFRGKIDYINPEILQTMQANNPLLLVNRKKREYAEPYCNIKYYQCDINSTEFANLLSRPYKNSDTSILDTHYFLVSLGSDEVNLSVANLLKEQIGKYHIETNEQKKKTIINYVVYNAALSDTLNSHKYVCSYDGMAPDIYMQAVGGVKQIYSASTVFMTEYEDAKKASISDYNKKQLKKYRTEAAKNRISGGEYEYWSNLALPLHFKYKVFSSGLIDFSLFDVQTKKINENTKEEKIIIDIKKTAYTHREKNLCSKEKYKKLAKGSNHCGYNRETIIKLQHCLQWLEHRRWNAFLRTMGYRTTKDYEAYFKYTENHKQMELKLHPCLVECDKNGVQGILKYDGTIENVCFDVLKKDEWDELDTFSYNYTKISKGIKEYKQYDYPNNDYLDKM